MSAIVAGAVAMGVSSQLSLQDNSQKGATPVKIVKRPNPQAPEAKDAQSVDEDDSLGEARRGQIRRKGRGTSPKPRPRLSRQKIRAILRTAGSLQRRPR